MAHEIPYVATATVADLHDLEAKIEELSRLSDTAGPGAFDAEIDALRAPVETLRREA